MNRVYLFLFLCSQEIQARFAGSLLGSIWLFVWPIIQLIIYIVIFGKLMGSRLGLNGPSYSYGFYIAAGFLPWAFFSTTLMRCSRCFIDKTNILKKVHIKMSLLIAIACATEFIPFAISFFIFCAAAFFCGYSLSLQAFGWVLLATYCLLILTVGLSLFFACASIFIRDIPEAVTVVLQIGFWFTPIVYLPSILPAWLADWLWLNPLTAITEIFQHWLKLAPLPNWKSLFYTFLICHCSLLLGIWCLNAWRRDMLDAI